MTVQLPVPVDQTRHTIFSSRAQGAFLENLSVNGNVRLACRAASVSPQTAYRARRRQPAFARAWDAALLSARDHAEQVLADRALNGIEEPVFYHGEEVAMRRRYSDRLLLAHLARLDRLEEREEVRETLEHLDDTIETLEKGDCIEDIPLTLRQAQDERERAPKSAHAEPAEVCADCLSEKHTLDRVPCVPSCRNCGGDCGGPDAEMTEEECVLRGERLADMDGARPEGAKPPHELARDHPGIDAQTIEDIQLAAFEDDIDEWWLVVPTREEWEGAAA